MDPSEIDRQRSEEPGVDRQIKAERIVALAWDDLPAAHRSLLEAIGADQYRVVGEPLGAFANRLAISAGDAEFSPTVRGQLDESLGIWVPSLRVMLVNAHHEKLDGLDDPSFEQMIAKIAWHEWAHALSLERATEDDIAAGEMLLDAAPAGISEPIRSANYAQDDLVHEVAAETYAFLMALRRRGFTGRPGFLPDEIYDLVRRVTGWTE